MRRTLLVTATLLLTTALSSPAGAENVVVAGEDGTFINRGADQVPVQPGVELRRGDVIKALGRTNLKAILGDTVVVFGPLSETAIAETNPLTLELKKGVLRFMSKPGSRSPVTLRTQVSQVVSTGGDVLIRYNSASQFTEVVTLGGNATAENRMGATGTAKLEGEQSTLLSPDSPPTTPSNLAEKDVAVYRASAALNVAPAQAGMPFAGADRVAERMERNYSVVRQQIARPTLPENAPYRTLDSHRKMQTTRGFDRPGLTTAPGDASLDVRWNFPQPTDN